jgi:hypothetical protein
MVWTTLSPRAPPLPCLEAHAPYRIIVARSSRFSSWRIGRSGHLMVGRAATIEERRFGSLLTVAVRLEDRSMYRARRRRGSRRGCRAATGRPSGAGPSA